MDKQIAKNIKKDARKARVRAVISGTAECPRLCVSRSNKFMYAQIIDDVKSVTIVSAHIKELEVGEEKATKVDSSFALGKILAKKAQDKKIERVVFDRSGNRYHGRIKAVADGAREGGLKF